MRLQESEQSLALRRSYRPPVAALLQRAVLTEIVERTFIIGLQTFAGKLAKAWRFARQGSAS